MAVSLGEDDATRPCAACPGRRRVGSTPAGLVAATTHFGPYGLMHEAHAAIRRWCQSNGHTLAGPSWEIYGHWTDECNRDPSKITTEICYLIADTVRE